MWVGTTRIGAFFIDISAMNKASNYFSETTSLWGGGRELPTNLYTDQFPVSNLFQPSNFNISYHNLVGSNNTNTPVFTDDIDLFNEEISAIIPLFLRGGNSIKIPNKTARAICRYVSRHLLREINPNIDIAIELCLMFLSNLTDTYYRMQGIGFEPDTYDKQGWKNLSSTALRCQFSDSPDTYRKIINALEQGTNKGPIIECDYWKIEGFKSYSYRLSEAYRCKGVESYQLKTEYAKKLNYQNYHQRIETAMSNPIGRNLIQFYKIVKLPTIPEIEAEAKRLIELKYRTKKGKLLTQKGKKKKSYWKNPQERSFVEESIEIFEYLTSDGLMIPSVTSERGGGRVVDSFTLMPSWIRNLCRIEGELIEEADYTALHPNIAMFEYGGATQYLTHQQVADEIKIDVKEVKIEHLSFFNKRWEDMKKSPLFEYYNQKEPELINNIFNHKDKSIHAHKATSRALFKKEVEIMTNVIELLNNQGIYVGYVYDALFCHPKDFDVVKMTMNKVILKHGVMTRAK